MQRKNVAIPPPPGLYPSVVGAEKTHTQIMREMRELAKEESLSRKMYCPFEAIQYWESINAQSEVPMNPADIFLRLSKLASKVGVNLPDDTPSNFESKQKCMFY